MTPQEFKDKLALHQPDSFRIKFEEEKHSYIVMAHDERYLICQKPFNAKKTFLYTIVDMERGVRGADNFYCGYEYDSPEGAKEALDELNGKGNPLSAFGISSRNSIPLKIEKLIIR